MTMKMNFAGEDEGQLIRGGDGGDRTSARVRRSGGGANRENFLESLKKQHEQESSKAKQLAANPVKDRCCASAALDLTIKVMRGEGLAACDYNLLGHATTSDPYVIVSILDGNQEYPVGTTRTCMQTLNPVWDEMFTKMVAPGTLKSDKYTIQLKLMDFDLMKQDDDMGIVWIPMAMENRIDAKPEWHEVAIGSAEKACGRVQVMIESKLKYSMASFLPSSDGAGATATGDPEKPATAPPTSLLGPASMMTAAASTMLGAGNMVASTAFGAGSAMKQGATTTVMGAFRTVEDVIETQKSQPQQDEEDDELYEKIYKEEEVLRVQVTVHRGDGLVAKDRNALGQKVSSDPYIVLEIWPQGIPLEENSKTSHLYPKLRIGRSPTRRKTLSPVWEHEFEPFNYPLSDLNMEEAQLRVRIVDDDFGLGEDDPMGGIDIYLRPKTHLEVEKRWYHVSATSADGAKGRLQLSLDSKQTIQKTVVGKKKKAVVKKKEPEKVKVESDKEDANVNDEQDEMHSSMPARYNHDEALVAADRDRDRVRSRLHRSQRIKSSRGVDGKEHRRHRRKEDEKDGSKRESRSRRKSRRSSDNGESGRRSRREVSKRDVNERSRRHLSESRKTNSMRDMSEKDNGPDEERRRSLRNERSIRGKDIDASTKSRSRRRHSRDEKRREHPLRSSGGSKSRSGSRRRSSRIDDPEPDASRRSHQPRSSGNRRGDSERKERSMSRRGESSRGEKMSTRDSSPKAGKASLRRIESDRGDALPKLSKSGIRRIESDRGFEKTIDASPKSGKTGTGIRRAESERGAEKLDVSARISNRKKDGVKSSNRRSDSERMKDESKRDGERPRHRHRREGDRKRGSGKVKDESGRMKDESNRRDRRMKDESSRRRKEGSTRRKEADPAKEKPSIAKDAIGGAAPKVAIDYTSAISTLRIS